MAGKYHKSSSEHKINYSFQGHPTRSQYIFYIDTECIEETFLTRVPELLKWIYKKHIPGQADKY